MGPSGWTMAGREARLCAGVDGAVRSCCGTTGEGIIAAQAAESQFDNLEQSSYL